MKSPLSHENGSKIKTVTRRISRACVVTYSSVRRIVAEARKKGESQKLFLSPRTKAETDLDDFDK
jgi:hypothetical protein